MVDVRTDGHDARLGAFERFVADTVVVGLRESRDLEGTHRFYRFLLSKLMCNGHLLNVSIPKSGKSDVGFSRSGFL